MSLQEPFTFSSNQIQHTEVVILKIIDDKGRFGLGSCSPYFPETGETADSTIKLLRKKLNPSFFSASIDNWYGYHEKIQKEFSKYPAAQAVVEIAVIHLFSKINNIAVPKLIGGYRDHCDVMMSIGIKNIPDTIADIKKHTKSGFSVFKIKVGQNLENDISKIHEIRKSLPKKNKLLLDANEGYSVSEAKKLITSLRGLNIAALEQPISGKNWAGLKQLSKLAGIPIIADQSITDTQVAIDLLNNDIVDGVNIKLMKCGGLINYLKIFQVARRLHKITMIGCMSESNISITAGAWLALGLPIDYIDLDSGHLDFPDEPGKGGAIVKNGQLTLGKDMYLAL